ncbi:MAG: hypothetical protein H6905_06700 [Hyphomicrobiales bacterium]|nr:hypothetical protein [Hyphomicrobiales bacterium]
MAFQSKDLSVLAYANGFTLWHYATNDNSNQTDAAQYFNSASDMLRVGDMILANVNQSGTPGAGVLVVTSNSGGAVDVANLTPFGANNDR